jgi:hypothetical protein
MNLSQNRHHMFANFKGHFHKMTPQNQRIGTWILETGVSGVISGFRFAGDRFSDWLRVAKGDRWSRRSELRFRLKK